MYTALATLFAIQVVTTAINTLKTILITKGISKPASALTFVDAILFAWSMKLTVAGEGVLFLIVYALGKTLGTILGDISEKKLALGILNITISAKQEIAIPTADHLRELGYSVNTRKVYGNHGNERFEVWLNIQRKEYKFLQETLNRLGVENASMVITEVKDVTGKIQTHHTEGY